MSASEFTFSLRFDDSRFEEMLGALTNAVVAHAGLAPPVVAELVAEVRGALARAGGRPCEVEFRARDRALEIAVSEGDRRILSASRQLPEAH